MTDSTTPLNTNLTPKPWVTLTLNPDQAIKTWQQPTANTPQTWDGMDWMNKLGLDFHEVYRQINDLNKGQCYRMATMIGDELVTFFQHIPCQVPWTDEATEYVKTLAEMTFITPYTPLWQFFLHLHNPSFRDGAFEQVANRFSVTKRTQMRTLFAEVAKPTPNVEVNLARLNQLVKPILARSSMLRTCWRLDEAFEQETPNYYGMDRLFIRKRQLFIDVSALKEHLGTSADATFLILQAYLQMKLNLIQAWQGSALKLTQRPTVWIEDDVFHDPSMIEKSKRVQEEVSRCETCQPTTSSATAPSHTSPQS